MAIKKIIKLFVPLKIRIARSLFLAYYYDYKRYSKYAVFNNRLSSEKQFWGVLTYHYHVIEKGLTMPEPRLGFAEKKIYFLIYLCTEYIKRGYDLTALEFVHSIQVLIEYINFHKKKNFLLDVAIVDKIQLLSEQTKIANSSEQGCLTNEDFFAYSMDSFDKFSASRHTIRNYSSREVDLDILHHCVELAQNTPSACNRQPNHVYIIKNRDIINGVLALQNGNRGFGFLANALIIFTSDISVFKESFERHEMYLNSGMYAMNFINALHFHKIGSCALNWSVTLDKDRLLRKLLNIPPNEVVTLTLSCGYLPDKVNFAKSPKKAWINLTVDIL